MENRRRGAEGRAEGLGDDRGRGAASPAVAQAQANTFYLDRLSIAGAPDDAIGMWRPQMGEKTRFYGQLGFGFGYEPFRLENYVASAQLQSVNTLRQPARPRR